MDRRAVIYTSICLLCLFFFFLNSNQKVNLFQLSYILITATVLICILNFLHEG